MRLGRRPRRTTILSARRFAAVSETRARCSCAIALRRLRSSRWLDAGVYFTFAAPSCTRCWSRPLGRFRRGRINDLPTPGLVQRARAAANAVGYEQLRDSCVSRGRRRADGSADETKRKICVVVTARPSYSRIRTALHGHPASTPISSCSWSSPRRRCSIATATPSRPSSATGSRSRRASTWCSRARTSSPRPSPPASGWSELATVFDNLRAGRRGHGRRSLRDAGDRGGGVVHEHPGRARAGRRSDRLDRREGAARGHQALEPAPRVDASGARARHPAGRGRRTRSIVTGCPSIDIAAEVAAQPGARLRSVREVRRRRSARPTSRRAIWW